MDIDPSPPSRKRRISSLTSQNNNNDDDDNDNDNTFINSDNDSPSKRLQSSHGLPIPRTQFHHLSTHLILNSLALTRLRVTANFSLYNPPTSPVILSITRSDDTLYRTLWSVSAPCHTLCSISRATKILTPSPLRPPIPLPPLSNPPKPLHNARGADFFRSLECVSASHSDLHDFGFG